MSERKFASVQKIVAIEPIPNYDKVELATVLGWCCIVQKGQFKVGDMVIYIEPDSKMPPRKEYEFLEKRAWKVKTLKMCKVISQGLILPLDVLPEIWLKKKAKEDMDLTADFGITHIDEVEEVITDNRKLNFFQRLWKRFYFRYFKKKEGMNFPKHLISETDEPNVQTIPRQLGAKKGVTCFVTEKLEGQSATFGLISNGGFLFFKKLKFVVCSHHRYYPLRINNNFWKIAEKLEIQKKLETLYKKSGDSFIIQGEIIGPSIQKNIYKVPSLDFYVFNVRNLTTKQDLPTLDAKNLVESIGLKFVPIIETLTLDDEKNAQWWVAYSNGRSRLFDVPREGVVVRNLNEGVSFKAKSPAYQLWF